MSQQSENRLLQRTGGCEMTPAVSLTRTLAICEGPPL